MPKNKDITARLQVGNGPVVRGSMKVNSPSSSGGTSDYNKLKNKPSIEHVELVGDKSFEELGLENMDNMDILKLFNEVFGNG